MEQFLYRLDPDSRKIARSLEKIKLKIIKKQCPIVLKKLARIYIYIYIYIQKPVILKL